MHCHLLMGVRYDTIRYDTIPSGIEHIEMIDLQCHIPIEK
jgi:hypothetical protein